MGVLWRPYSVPSFFGPFSLVPALSLAFYRQSALNSSRVHRNLECWLFIRLLSCKVPLEKARLAYYNPPHSHAFIRPLPQPLLSKYLFCCFREPTQQTSSFECHDYYRNLRIQAHETFRCPSEGVHEKPSTCCVLHITRSFPTPAKRVAPHNNSRTCSRVKWSAVKWIAEL